jgi:hypothetical protein
MKTTQISSNTYDLEAGQSRIYVINQGAIHECVFNHNEIIEVGEDLEQAMPTSGDEGPGPEVIMYVTPLNTHIGEEQFWRDYDVAKDYFGKDSPTTGKTSTQEAEQLLFEQLNKRNGVQK